MKNIEDCGRGKRIKKKAQERKIMVRLLFILLHYLFILNLHYFIVMYTVTRYFQDKEILKHFSGLFLQRKKEPMKSMAKSLYRNFLKFIQ